MRNGPVKIGKKIIGEIDQERKVFAKKVDLKKHLFRKLDAWGIDGYYFKHVLLPENYKIKLFECQEGKVYETDAKTFDEHGVWLHFKGKGVDHGAQAFLARQYWK